MVSKSTKISISPLFESSCIIHSRLVGNRSVFRRGVIGPGALRDEAYDGRTPGYAVLPGTNREKKDTKPEQTGLVSLYF